MHVLKMNYSCLEVPQIIILEEAQPLFDSPPLTESNRFLILSWPLYKRKSKCHVGCLFFNYFYYFLTDPLL